MISVSKVDSIQDQSENETNTAPRQHERAIEEKKLFGVGGGEQVLKLIR